ncbi:MAG: hypothetical protein AB7E49_04590 [Campylobacterales bacterium]
MKSFRFLIIVALLPFWGWADAIDDKVRSLVDPKSYVVHQRLIDIIFRDRSAFFLDETRLDSVKVVTTLKENGLLDIFYRSGPRNLSATFRTHQSPPFFLKAIGDSLSELGYNFTLTSSMRQDGAFFEWQLAYRSDHAIDPALLAKRLSSYGILIEDISKEEDRWFYTLTATAPMLPEATYLEADLQEPLTLLNPMGEYWVDLNQTGGRVGVRRKTGGLWFPYAVFYDRDLRILRVMTHEQALRTLFVRVPENAAYLKITDNYTTENLKHGIQLWLESSN